VILVVIGATAHAAPGDDLPLFACMTGVHTRVVVRGYVTKRDEKLAPRWYWLAMMMVSILGASTFHIVTINVRRTARPLAITAAVVKTTFCARVTT